MHDLKKIRSFLSLNISEKEKSTLSVFQERLKNQLINYPIKWEDPEKFHLTLRFLGDLTEENIERLIFTLERLKFDFEEIRYSLSGAGFFPDRNKPRVIYFEMNELGTSAVTLIGFIDKIIRNFKIKTENKFIPHVTAGRFLRKNQTRIHNDFSFKVEPVEITFSSFYLMKSLLTPSGSFYEVIHEFRFNN